jgi:hypothetical protein
MQRSFASVRVALLVLALFAASERALACSSAQSRLIAVPTPRTLYLLGTARPDSMRAGAALIELADDRSGAATQERRENVHGQLFDVERFAGPARDQIPRGMTRALLVPWGYTSDCKPIIRHAATWVEGGRRVMVDAVLRNKRYWLGGVPILDVFFAERNDVYVRGAAPWMASRQFDTASMMPAEELLDVLDMLPDTLQLRRDALSAPNAVFAWARANPERARLYPAAQLIHMLRVRQRMSELQSVESPATGTYRLTLRVNDGAPYTLFARTSAVPESGYRLAPAASSTDPLHLDPFDLYSYVTFLAATVDSLPTDCRGRYDRRTSGFSIPASTPSESSAGAQLSANVDMRAFEIVFRGDTLMARVVRASFNAAMESYRRKESPFRGTILLDSIGTARVRQVETLGDGTRTQMEGERVSRTTIACEPR